MNPLETSGPLLSNDWGLAYELLKDGCELITCSEFHVGRIFGQLTNEIMAVGVGNSLGEHAWYPASSCDDFLDIVERTTFKGTKFLVPPGVVSRRQDRESHIPEKPANQEPTLGLRESITSIEGGTV